MAVFVLGNKYKPSCAPTPRRHPIADEYASVTFTSPFQIFPHGSTDALPFATMGSGSLNAMAVFEAGYKDDMTREEAIDLATRAIRRYVCGVCRQIVCICTCAC
jgi:hypothetical protein